MYVINLTVLLNIDADLNYYTEVVLQVQESQKEVVSLKVQ